jgi:TonB-linked SusC/RagA family outer membrane protein
MNFKQLKNQLRRNCKKQMTKGFNNSMKSFCMLLVLLAISLASSAQITVKIKNLTVRKSLQRIENVSKYKFFYSENLPDLDHRVTVSMKDVSLDQAMAAILAGTNLTYESTSQFNVVLKQKNKTVVEQSNVSSNDNNKHRIIGKITDANGEPIIGASVIEKGTSNGGTTDSNGIITLDNIPAGTTLIISYVGFASKEIKVNNKNQFKASLEEDTQQLQDVVVIGYGSMDKKQVTSSITSIKAKDLMVGVGGSDISQSMQGKISGLVINNIGSANAGTTFQLRGMTSINAGRTPLIVIDGFPGGDIRSLTQEDILSIDVLKDASAGAIYGTRAASGVILITTKKGSNTIGKVKLTYEDEFSHKQSYNAPKMLSGREYAEHSISTDYGSDTDWFDELINHGNFSQKHHISLNYGTQLAQLYSSVYYEKNEGIAINDGREDFGGRVNALFKLFDGWLEIKPYIDYRQAHRNNHYPHFAQALFNNPTRSPYKETSATGYNIWTSESYDYNVVADSEMEYYYGVDKWFKPQINLKLNIKPIPGLSYQQTIGYENRQWEDHEYWPSTARNQNLESQKGQATLGFSKGENLTSEGYLSYINEFKGGHSVNAVAGYSYFESNGDNFSMTNYDFSVDGIKCWNIGEGSYLALGKASMSSGKSITGKLASLFTRVNYSYQNRYMLAASLRHEGSSKFAKDNRWANFWSLSGGWRISKESFMKNLKWIDDLKLRIGYGVTGNNNFSATYMANLLGADTKWMMPDGTWAYSYGKTQNVNPKLGWEKKKELNIGLDYSLFKGRLYGKFDWFSRNITNLLYSVAVPQPPYTMSSQWQNIGKMRISGWEFEIGGDDILKTNNFSWSSHLNLSHNSGKITTLWGDNTYYNGDAFPSPGSPGYAHRINEGSKIGSFYIWKFAGFDENGNFQVYDKDGQIISADKKTELDRQFIGNYTPKLIASWNNTFTYKKFDLGISMRSWIKFDVYNTLNMYFGIQGRSNFNVLKDAYGKNDKIRGEKQICDYFLEDGTFLKIDAITLGYTLPMGKITNNLVERIRFYGTVGNVCTLTGYNGMDPEVNITGWDEGIDRFWSGLYPNVRTYTFGMQFNF